MDFKQLENFIEITKENNITRAAENLFLTQSALNQQLLKLEKDLGTQLFYRKRKGWHLTEAGQIYLDAAKQILEIKKNTYNRIQDIEDAKMTTITIGITPERGLKMFSKAFPKFQKEFPGIMVTPIEATVKKQEELLLNNEIDLGFMTLLDTAKSGFSYEELSEEQLVLVTSKDHPLAHLAALPPDEVDLRLFADESFCFLYQTSSLRPLVDSIFTEAGFKPKAVLETANNSAIATIVQAGIACGVVPMFHAKLYADQLAIFKLAHHPTFKVAVCTKQGKYMSKAEKRFIEICHDYWQQA